MLDKILNCLVKRFKICHIFGIRKPKFQKYGKTSYLSGVLLHTLQVHNYILYTEYLQTRKVDLYNLHIGIPFHLKSARKSTFLDFLLAVHVEFRL